MLEGRSLNEGKVVSKNSYPKTRPKRRIRKEDNMITKVVYNFTPKIRINDTPAPDSWDLLGRRELDDAYLQVMDRITYDIESLSNLDVGARKGLKVTNVSDDGWGNLEITYEGEESLKEESIMMISTGWEGTIFVSSTKDWDVDNLVKNKEGDSLRAVEVTLSMLGEQARVVEDE